ncbi:MAG: sugar phosphate isomerase/epimerase [Clostridia bacterium]|nr:sugar phosphate isomerase/epimerase [Clostridia bacterium]
MKKFPVALQLYSVRDALSADFEGTLKKVAEMGYVGVEFAGLHNHTPEQVKAMCEKYGLRPLSAHVPYTEMMQDPEKVMRDYAAIGCSYITLPYYNWKFEEGGETYEDFIGNVRMLGAAAKAHGMTLLYHNHDFEFEKMDGKYRLDRLYEDVTSDLLQTELDACWVNVGGENPAEYIRKYTGRTPVVHLKDFAGQKSDKMYALIGIDDGEQSAAAEEQAFGFRPVGYGLQNFPEILEAATDSGAEWVVVEQDEPSMDKTPMECAAMSREYLKGLGL